MDPLGIGLAGIDGIWWRRAAEPFVLPRALNHDLQAAADATFALFDAAGIACDDDDAARAALSARVPTAIPRYFSTAPLLCVRPDFQLIETGDARRYRLAATELEVCPSAQGVAHVMQRGYGLSTDLADAWAAMCAGRPLRIVMAAAWSEFMWDQLVLCAALRERGVDAQVLFDMPWSRLKREIADGTRWTPPMFGVPRQPKRWDRDVAARLVQHSLSGLVAHALLPDHALIYRFGYGDCFTGAWQRRLIDYEQRGCVFVNPPSFAIESKVMLALGDLASVRAQLNVRQRRTLATSLLPTVLLTPELIPQLIEARARWVLKFAGFDRNQQSWGGRSLQVGAQHSARSWRRVLESYCALPFPCVAQQAAPSAILTVPAHSGRTVVPFRGRSRLRAFFVRVNGQARVAGVHLTVAGRATAVSESVAALQTPVVFA